MYVKLCPGSVTSLSAEDLSPDRHISCSVSSVTDFAGDDLMNLQCRKFSVNFGDSSQIRGHRLQLRGDNSTPFAVNTVATCAILHIQLLASFLTSLGLNQFRGIDQNRCHKNQRQKGYSSSQHD